jgi:hypothetical protein
MTAISGRYDQCIIACLVNGNRIILSTMIDQHGQELS